MKLHGRYSRGLIGLFYYGERGEVPLRINVFNNSSLTKIEDPLHYHKKSVQFFLVIEGEIVVEVNGKKVNLSQNKLLEINPGEKYCVKEIKKGSKFVVIGTKNVEGDRMEVKQK